MRDPSAFSSGHKRGFLLEGKTRAASGSHGTGVDLAQFGLHRRLGTLLAILLLSTIFTLAAIGGPTLNHIINYSRDLQVSVCQQTDPIAPSEHQQLFAALEALFDEDTYKLNVYESLGGAVRIPTVTRDEDKPPGQDDHWEVFKTLHEYLENRFPAMHSRLIVEKVNTYALVYHWQGSDAAKKPILLAAHQDVVPVLNGTLSDWIHPPFSGHYDGEWIWGRGTCDDKSGLIATMTAVETLLKAGFEPSRSIVLAYGIDEEKGGVSGATAIRDFLLETYGLDGFSVLIDEGGPHLELFGTTFAMPAIAEKGKLDVRMEISSPGGHSSVPPAHTSIGMLARMITELEANPHSSVLSREAIYYQRLQCIAEYGSTIPPSLRRLIRKSRSNDKALKALEDNLAMEYTDFKANTGTTQAVDLVYGGVKSNALPEQAYAVINHRISESSSVEELKGRFTDIVQPIAAEYGLSINAFGRDIRSNKTGSTGHLELADAYGTALQPAPISPTYGHGPWVLLSGSIRASLSTAQRRNTGLELNDVIVSPGLMIANTDTRHYWDLTKYIYRYSHQSPSDLYNGAHTVNEAIRAEGFLEMIRFFTIFILNADETDLMD